MIEKVKLIENMVLPAALFEKIMMKMSGTK
jgi:hypothetical protein